LLDAQSKLEQSKADAAANLITLCKVLGGGWESTYAKQDSSAVMAAAKYASAPVAPDLFLRITSVCPHRVFELDAKAPRLGPYRSHGPDRQQSPLN
jgi:hypothetical protein